MELSDLLSKFSLAKVSTTIILVVIVFIIYKFIVKHVRKAVLNKVKGKKEISNVKVLFNLIRYVFFFIIFLIIIVSFTGSFSGLGISAGLLTAALGWALQRPITGIAAWIMVLTKRPFQIGDRISIGSVKGDVSDITLTHIYLSEVGGTVNTEESSGRVIMIPNSTLFEQNIINYTLHDEFILDEVSILISYESNLDKAISICEESANKVCKDWKDKANVKARMAFGGSGINVKVTYFTPAFKRVSVASDITMHIFNDIKKEKDVEIT